MRRTVEAKDVVPMRPMRDWIGGRESTAEITPIRAPYGRAGLTSGPMGLGTAFALAVNS